MKIVIRTVIFHLLCIIIFGLLYYYYRDQYQYQYQNKYKNTEKTTFIDYIFLSTTIQSGVGLSDIYPISYYGKLTMIVQQIIMIMTHVFTIYIFNI
jgi:hypothetical protein